MSKRILITGASTGIGAALARRLAPGNDLVVHYHQSKAEAEAVAAAVLAAGGKAELLQADLSREDGCQKVAAHLAATGARLDILINNTGALVRRVPAKGITWDFLLETFSLNTFSAIRLTALCLPFLEAGTDPNILFVTSIAARHGAPGATVYGASKGALDTFTRGLAKELAPRIRVNAVAPGVIETPFHAKATSPQQMQAFRDATPVKRNGTAEEIAQAAEFLVTNGFCTGSTVDVNGGLFMR